MQRLAVLGFVLGLVPACGAPSAPRGAAPALTLEPAAPLDQSPPVVRVHVHGVDVDPSALALFQGTVDAYYSGKIAVDVVPDALAARRVASLSWRDPADADSGDLVLAPSVELAAGATYGVAALGRGAIGSFIVAAAGAEPAPFAARLWPPVGATAGGARAVFCGALDSPMIRESVVFDPADANAVAEPGVGAAGDVAERCLHFDVEAPMGPAFAVPPPIVHGTSIDPAPVAFADFAGATTPASCDATEQPLTPGCVRVLDDRVIIRSASAPLLWTVLPGGAVVPAPAGGRFVVTGLVPASHVVLHGTVMDLSGRETPFSASADTASAMPHVVINEVLANPVGPEPAQEWVELTNDGEAPVDVGEWTLDDGHGTTALPAATLAPGAFALVVTNAFDATESRDVVPARGTPLLRVPSLGKSGLSNDGETLTLRSSDGTVRSVFPAIAAPTPGVSIARRSPSALDDDPDAFGPHGGAGASPGWANVLASP